MGRRSPHSTNDAAIQFSIDVLVSVLRDCRDVRSMGKHVIAGLIQLGAYQELVEIINDPTRPGWMRMEALEALTAVVVHRRSDVEAVAKNGGSRVLELS